MGVLPLGGLVITEGLEAFLLFSLHIITQELVTTCRGPWAGEEGTWRSLWRTGLHPYRSSPIHSLSDHEPSLELDLHLDFEFILTLILILT